jgi:hypothetical protein
MALSLAEAAEATGRNRSTILRGIRRGMISATRDPRTQAWLVEPAELFRVFPPVLPLQPAEAAQGSAQAPRAGEAAQIAVLTARLEAAEQRLADAHAMIAAHEATIEDLRRRLDTATAQLGDALTQVRLLTDQRVPARRAWWRWRG